MELLKSLQIFLFFFSTLGGLVLNIGWMHKVHRLKKKDEIDFIDDSELYVREIKKFVMKSSLGKVYLTALAVLIGLSLGLQNWPHI